MPYIEGSTDAGKVYGKNLFHKILKHALGSIIFMSQDLRLNKQIKRNNCFPRTC